MANIDKDKAQAEAMKSRGAGTGASQGRSVDSPLYHGQFGEAINQGVDVVQLRMISRDELLLRLDEVTVLDARPAKSYESSTDRIRGAVRVDTDNLAWAAGQDKNQPLVVYCDCPGDEAAVDVARRLIERGFTNVWALRGGLAEWKRAGLPTEDR
jgi:rhodanese-related sulfurtransferase